jgi:hypothetical protein
VKERLKKSLSDGSQGRGSKKLLDDFKKTKRILTILRGSSRSHFLENSLRKRGYGLVVRQTTQ